jgi:hypothetical protein
MKEERSPNPLIIDLLANAGGSSMDSSNIMPVFSSYQLVHTKESGHAGWNRYGNPATTKTLI